MATIRIAIHTVFHTPSVSNVNYFLYNDTSPAALVDDTGAATGLSFQLQSAFSQLNHFSYAGGDRHGIEQDIIQGSGAYTNGNIDFVISGSDTITNVDVWGASGVDDAVRMSRYTHNAANVDHDCRNYGLAGPVSLPSLGSLPMTINIAVAPSANFCYLSYIEITTADGGGGNTVDTIDDPILDGETGNALTYTGFTTASINLITADGVACSSIIDDDAGNVTFSVPGISGVTNDAGTTVPNFGTIDFVVGNGTESDTVRADLNPKAGWALVAAASLDTSDENGLYQLMLTEHGITIADGWPFYFPTTGNTSISTAGFVSTDLTSLDFVIIDPAGPTAYPVEVVINGSGPTPAPSGGTLVLPLKSAIISPTPQSIN